MLSSRIFTSPVRVFHSLVILLLLAAACAPLEYPPTGNNGDSAASQPVILAPDGEPARTYYAPFPVKITLNGNLDDWAGVPVLTLPAGVDVESANTALTFAAAADEQFLYFMGNVIDSNIISGQHGNEYWNEDSIEFYINATGDLTLPSYVSGVAQISVPAINIDLTPETGIIGGINGSTVGAKVAAQKTGRGWAVEVAIPLVNDVWNLTPEHGHVIGFQVHLNGASTADRDTKLIWSEYDEADTSYQDPSVFGQLIFFKIGSDDIPPSQPAGAFAP